MALFEPDKYRTSEKEDRKVERLVVVMDGADESALQKGVERGQHHRRIG